MDFLFFDELQKKNLVPALIVASSIASFLLIVYGLRLGITYVLPHLLYIPIILTAYYYPRRGLLFAALLSASYCAVSFFVVTPAAVEILSAIIRAGVFLVVAGVVSFLSGQMHHDTQICRRLVSVVRSSGDAIIGKTPEGFVSDWNAGAERLYGYTSDEMKGNSIFRLIPPELKEEHHLMLEMILQGEMVEHVETERITRDGQRIQVSLSLSPIRSNAGGIIGISELAHDITERQQLQNEILNAKDRWERTFDAVPDMIAIIDDHFRIVQVNRAMADHLGVSPNETVGLTCYEVVHHTGTPPATCLHKKLLLDGQYHSTDIREETLNGDFVLTVSPIRDPSGTILGSVHILRDISERKLAEKQVQESEKKYRSIFNSFPDLYYQTDQNGIITILSPSVKRLAGWAPEDLIGHPVYELYPFPEERAGLLETLRCTGEVQGYEITLKHRDGCTIPASVSCHQIYDDAGELAAIEGTIRDITQRKQGEAAFRQLSADHRAIIEHTPAMIWYKDTKNTFIRINPAGAQAFGIPIEEIEGKNAAELFPDLAEKYYLDDLEVIASGRSKIGIIESMTTASGEHLWIQIDKILLRNEEGTISGILLVAMDITERKQAEDALALASKKLNLLSSVTRHDMLNQLTALKGYIDLSEEEPDEEMRAKFIRNEGIIADSLERQITFTGEYQDLGVNAPTWQNVLASVEKAVTLLPMREVTVKKDCADCEIFADLLFEKVFYNLIDNALRYGGESMTTIRISSHESGGHLILVCEDDGKGISADDKKRLFTRGFGKHTGLGLFLSQEILSITGITITETGELGKGARFEITVPKGAYLPIHRYTGSISRVVDSPIVP
ncbi:PAS domain S-box protein [Methanosphaerula palustris]|uniref:histidine kinase n=1 Tax=Methanosphaerula palustris (strain ATCC BAA-1556 / DSM 19958 / E1-9c) TaxID=521011 RepID=B8GF20_METPE|nr:PAS domain S-box protein [Methanosphaerula palustris]ACL17826.1 PAS/PAC sensor signal transduction histidine kinase [Methanosphaerula palustris E1-9c]